MKRILRVCLLCALLCLLSVQAFAAELNENGFERLPSAKEFEEISQLEPMLLETVNRNYKTEYGSDAEPILPEEIRWEDAYKVYIDTDVYAAGSDSAAQLEQTLENAPYLWQLPILTEHALIVVDFAIAAPLPENAKELLGEELYEKELPLVGTWQLNTVSFYTDKETYPQRLLASLEQNGQNTQGEKIILGGFSKMRSLVGLTMNNGKIETVTPVESPRVMGTPTGRAQRSSGITSVEQGETYEFSQMAAYLKTVKPPTGDADGGSGSMPTSTGVFLVVTLLLIGLAAVIFRVRWKIKH